MLAIIATGETLSGLMIESTTFDVVGVSMFLIPIYISAAPDYFTLLLPKL